MSCSLFQNSMNRLTINGVISTTKYKIPVESTVFFYFSNKLVSRTETDKKGVFSVTIPARYSNKKCMIIGEPIVHKLKKDSLVENGEIRVMIIPCQKRDTIFFDTLKDNQNINLEIKNCGIHKFTKPETNY